MDHRFSKAASRQTHCFIVLVNCQDLGGGAKTFVIASVFARFPGTQVVSGDASDQILKGVFLKTEGYPHKIEEGSPKIVEG